MGRLPSKKSLFFIFPLFFSFYIKASDNQLKPEYGLVKSRDGVAFLSCEEKEEGSKVCRIYAQKKGEEAKAISREMKFIKLEKKSKSFSSYIDRETKHEELLSASYMPITTLTRGLIATKGEKYAPLFFLSTFDLVAGPVTLIVDGCRRLYKLIQGTYLQKAWKTIVGVNQKESMRLSRKDFKDFLKAIKTSAV